MFHSIRLVTPAALLLLSLIGPSKAAEVNFKQSWAGKHQDNQLKTLAPANGVITDTTSWNKLWKAWQGDDAPEINFDDDFVIVALANGPNKAMVRTLKLDEAGDLQFFVMSTRRGGPGFGFNLLQVPREGIKSVNGKALPTSGAAAGTDSQPNRRKGEFIEVTVGGKFQTGIMAIGGESTGSIIKANNVTWELDFKRSPQLLKQAESLNGKLVTVTGELKKMKGVEIAERWIVSVTEMKPQD